MNSQIIFLALLILIFVFSTLYWKLAFKAGLYFLIFEGIFRKWIFPESNYVIYFIKDIIFLGSYFGCYLSGCFKVPAVLKNNYVGILFFLYMGWTFFEIWNPSVPNIQVGLFGLKTHLFYLPMIIMVCKVFDSSSQVLNFLRWYYFLAIPNLVLAYFQFFAKGDSLLNIYAGGYSAAAGMPNGFIRVVGTFPYLSGFASYLFFIILLGFGLIVERNLDLRKNLPVVFVLILSLSAVLLTGARGIVISLLLDLVLFIFLLYKKNLINMKFIALVLFVPVIAYMTINFGMKSAYNSFMNRVQTSHDVLERIQQFFTTPVDLVEDAGFLGYGTGSQHQAIAYLVSNEQEISAAHPISIEGEVGRVMVELGTVGALLFVLCKLIVIWMSYISARISKNTSEFGLALISIMFLLPHFFNNTLYNVTAAIYYWFLVGAAVLIINNRYLSNYRNKHIKSN